MADCKVCGEEFTPSHPTQKICSRQCREVQQKLSKKKYHQKKLTKSKAARWASNYRKRNPILSRFMGLRARAMGLGIPFDLDIEDVLIPEVCPALGIPLDGSTRDNQWSFDKLLPEKGYTKDNCRIISMKANRLKNNATLEELEQIVAYMKKELDF